MRPEVKALVEAMAKHAYACWVAGNPVAFGPSDADWNDESEETREEFRADARNHLVAIEAHGVRLVPVEMTETMARTLAFAAWHSGSGVKPASVWAKTLIDSPYAPESNDLRCAVCDGDASICADAPACGGRSNDDHQQDRSDG